MQDVGRSRRQSALASWSLNDDELQSGYFEDEDAGEQAETGEGWGTEEDPYFEEALLLTQDISRCR